MTTHLNHEGEKVIPPEKIKIIQDSRGRTDALSVILEIYENYRDTVKNVDDLDKFIQYVMEKEKENDEERKRAQGLGKATVDVLEDTIYIDETTSEMQHEKVNQQDINQSK